MVAKSPINTTNFLRAQWNSDNFRAMISLRIFVESGKWHEWTYGLPESREFFEGVNFFEIRDFRAYSAQSLQLRLFLDFGKNSSRKWKMRAASDKGRKHELPEPWLYCRIKETWLEIVDFWASSVTSVSFYSLWYYFGKNSGRKWEISAEPWILLQE